MQTYEDEKLISSVTDKMGNLFKKAEEMQDGSVKPLHHVIAEFPKKDSIIKVHGLEYKIVNSNPNKGMFIAKILEPKQKEEK